MSFRPRAQLPDPEPESIELRTSTINMARDSELEPEHGEATHLIESREGSVAQNMKRKFKVSAPVTSVLMRHSTTQQAQIDFCSN